MKHTARNYRQPQSCYLSFHTRVTSHCEPLAKMSPRSESEGHMTFGIKRVLTAAGSINFSPQTRAHYSITTSTNLSDMLQKAKKCQRWPPIGHNQHIGLQHCVLVAGLHNGEGCVIVLAGRSRLILFRHHFQLTYAARRSHKRKDRRKEGRKNILGQLKKIKRRRRAWQSLSFSRDAARMIFTLSSRSHVVVGADVAVDRTHRSVAKGQQDDIDVEHPVEVGEYFRSVLKT